MERLHPDLDALSFLIGVWRGAGRGRYPTIDPFEYVEEVRYAPGPAKPFIAYRQRTSRAGAGGGEPLHTEAGYIRPAGAGRAELVITQPTGIVEVHTGEVEGGRIDFCSTVVGRSPTAVEVSRVERRLRVEGGVMRYRLDMAAVGRPMQNHLEAELVRQV